MGYFFRDIVENFLRLSEFVAVINNQLSKMKWLITNILKISKLDADATEFKREEVSISKVLDDSLKPFVLTAELKNVAIQNGANDFVFNGDESWTVEAVSNIVKNCLEHTNDGGKILPGRGRRSTSCRRYGVEVGCPEGRCQHG